MIFAFFFNFFFSRVLLDILIYRLTSGESELETFYISLQGKRSQAPPAGWVRSDVSRLDQQTPVDCRPSSPGPDPDSGPAALPGPDRGGTLPVQQK